MKRSTAHGPGTHYRAPARRPCCPAKLAVRGKVLLPCRQCKTWFALCQSVYILLKGMSVTSDYFPSIVVLGTLNGCGDIPNRVKPMRPTIADNPSYWLTGWLESKKVDTVERAAN